MTSDSGTSTGKPASVPVVLRSLQLGPCGSPRRHPRPRPGCPGHHDPSVSVLPASVPGVPPPRLPSASAPRSRRRGRFLSGLPAGAQGVGEKFFQPTSGRWTGGGSEVESVGPQRVSRTRFHRLWTSLLMTCGQAGMGVWTGSRREQSPGVDGPVEPWCAPGGQPGTARAPAGGRPRPLAAARAREQAG